MTAAQVISGIFIFIEYALKIIAIGTVPENRRPSSSQAWLLIILLLPGIGFPLYWLIGSPYVRGRRNEIQGRANELLANNLHTIPLMPEGVDSNPALDSLVRMNRALTSLPCVEGSNLGLYPDTQSYYAAMAEEVDRAEQFVHVEFYIMAWDATTDVLFSALARAVQRGVKVRLLLDHLGSRKYPDWSGFRKRMTAVGIEWHLMMPIDPLRGRWRRPDLRNHRKLLVVDNRVGFMGSHNVIDPSYGSKKNKAMSRRWQDLSLKVSGEVVNSLDAVFSVDWYTETGETLAFERERSEQPVDADDPASNAMMIVPSGPGFATEPNLRLFTSLINMANHDITIASPYFVPDESLLGAITTACYRGVTVDLFVGAEADQFAVGHAQRSYYLALLEAGVRIFLYPAPEVLHSKYMTVDGTVAIIGSSNMDFRSFALDYEVTLMAFGGNLVEDLHGVDAEYRYRSQELTLEQWRQQPWYARYVDNVMRLTSALM